ncbi:MAG: AzlC family ABC transporter permease [Ruminococcus sp.]|nr:AzlC family ABC transporter permease [Ruminococcus sp.]
MRLCFRRGLIHGLPIALGYFSVSFGFGIMAVRTGLSVIEALTISMTNLTSAGQAAGVSIIAACGTYLEMAVTQLVINIRYSLMGLSLSQKLDSSFNTAHRLAVSFGITDEIFAMASAQPGRLTPRYMYGLILISFIGWSGGTLFGAVAGNILPVEVTNAMGIVLYGMFLAIIIPAAKKEKSILAVILIAALCSSVLYYAVPALSSGFAVIISAVIAAAFAAVVFPVPAEEENKA